MDRLDDEEERDPKHQLTHQKARHLTHALSLATNRHSITYLNAEAVREVLENLIFINGRPLLIEPTEVRADAACQGLREPVNSSD